MDTDGKIDTSRRRLILDSTAAVGLVAGSLLMPGVTRALSGDPPILLTNFELFDGQRLEMQSGLDILVQNGRVLDVLKSGQGPAEATVLDCGGRSVIPGLIDCHVHMTLMAVTELVALSGDVSLVHLIAGQQAGAMLRRGFTTVRDVGGPVFGLKMAIDRGILEGPKIFPSGAAISQTSGHGDFRMLHELPRMPSTPASRIEAEGVNVIADGVPEVLRRSREQLMKGASQLKIMAGGGVSSLYDPLDTVQYSLEEMRAAVQSATDWGTYVCAHAYTPKGIKRCVEAGIKSIEHGQLADQESAKRMADAGVWWSIQPFLADEDANPKTDPRSREKQQAVADGTVRAFELGRKHRVRMAFGTDILFNPAGAASQGRQLAKFARFMSPLEALRLATGAAGELLSLSGERAPYEGPLGVIKPGAPADLLVVDANPSENLDWLANPNDALALIMKDGRTVVSRL